MHLDSAGRRNPEPARSASPTPRFIWHHRYEKAESSLIQNASRNALSD
jgi:hypothetical protein